MLMSLLKKNTIALVITMMLAILAISLHPELLSSLLLSNSCISLLCTGIIIGL
jgi:hypothetical protein